MMEEGSTQLEERQKLKLKMLRGINMTLYPPHRVHYLAYALQHGIKPPSLKTMDRCDRRNAHKSGSTQANKITKRRIAIPRYNMGNLNSSRPYFNIPKRFGPQPVKQFSFRERGAAKVIHPKGPVFRKRRVFPQRKPISLPAEFVAKIRTKKTMKAKQTAITIHSPEWII